MTALDWETLDASKTACLADFRRNIDALSPTQAMALFCVAVWPGQLTVQNIAVRIGRGRVEVSRALGAFEKQGVVMSVTDPQDRRSRKFWITLAGKPLARRALALVSSHAAGCPIRTKEPN